MKTKASVAAQNVWDRQPGETAKQFEGFYTYREMPASERSIAKVGERLGKSEKLMGRWSSLNAWVRRSREYDAWLDQVTQQETRRANENKKVGMLERHTSNAVFIQNNIITALKEMVDEDWQKVSFGQKISAFQMMAQFERLSRGLPSTSIEIRTPEQIRDQTITEAMLYLKEMKHDFPVLSEREHLLIVCEEFEVQPEDLGYKPADLEPQEIGDVG